MIPLAACRAAYLKISTYLRLSGPAMLNLYPATVVIGKRFTAYFRLAPM
jgi:hypothetical protein